MACTQDHISQDWRNVPEVSFSLQYHPVTDVLCVYRVLRHVSDFHSSQHAHNSHPEWLHRHLHHRAMPAHHDLNRRQGKQPDDFGRQGTNQDQSQHAPNHAPRRPFINERPSQIREQESKSGPGVV